MNNSEKSFDPHESLAIITSMIEAARHTISDKSAYFLLWGWAVFIGGISQYVMLVILNYEKHYYAWLVIPATMVVFFILLFREKKKETVKSFVNDANAHVWMIIGMSFIPVVFISSASKWTVSSFPLFILLYGIGTSISGALIKFKPLRIGGMICLVLAAVTGFLPYPQQILLCSVAVLISYIIPGHLLRRHYQIQKKNVHG